MGAAAVLAGACLGTAFGGQPQETGPAAPAGAAQTVRVVVTLTRADGAAPAGDGFVVFKGTASDSPRVVPARLPGPVTAELPAGSQWTLIPDFPGYYAAPSIVQVSPSAATEPARAGVTLWPAGLLTGRFSVAAGERLPNRLEARFEPPRDPAVAGAAGGKTSPSGTATCAVNDDGNWRCRVPAGNLNLALHPEGFVPRYFWSVAVKAGETSALDAIKLVRGASVAGWIAREDGSPSETCKVRLEPASGPGRPNDATLEFLRTVAREAPCQRGGFFQLAAVAAGTYTVVAEDGTARAQLSPLDVWEGSESRISVPITLRRPVDFEVEISPPADWLGRPWRFEARRALDHRSGWEDPSFRAEADGEGRVRIPKRLPGRYWLTVYDGLGNALFSDMQVELDDPARAHSIELDLIRVEGTVQLGEQPIEARLSFGGRSGATTILLTSDEEGRFEGPLPRAGTWRVDVVSLEPRFQASTRVEIKPREGQAFAAIELPDTRVRGRVVAPSGSLVTDASVGLRSAVSTLVTEVNAKGEFELRAFPEGTIELFAYRSAGRDSREESDTYRFEAVRDSTQGPVSLVLRKNRKVKGRAIAPAGPVIGASIDAAPTNGGSGMASTVRTGLDGGFELAVPEDAPSLAAIVSPPGGALKAYEIPLADRSELLVAIEPLGGELVIDLGKDNVDEAFGDRVLAVWQDEAALPFGTLVRWSEGHGGRFFDRGLVRIPQLAPASYTVCLGAPSVADGSGIEAWRRRARCAAGYLAAGSTLNLQLR